MGSSMFTKNKTIFYHGVLNISEDVELIEKYLKHPSKEPNAYFMTLTISDENYEILKNTCKSEDENTIATKAIHLMLERIRKKRELIKDWIYEGVHAGKEISGEILNWIMRGTPKTITEVTSRLEELFDAKGNETGSKMVKQTITKGAK